MKQSMAWCIVLATLCGDMLLAQVPTAPPKLAKDVDPVFEVVTIKRSRPEERLAMLVKGCPSRFSSLIGSFIPSVPGRWTGCQTTGSLPIMAINGKKTPPITAPSATCAA